MLGPVFLKRGISFVAVLMGIALVPAIAQYAATDWSDHGGGVEDGQYSPLKQINRSNVSQLKIAWTFPTGDLAGLVYSPIEADGVLYVQAKGGSIAAVDAGTGEPLWSYAADFARSRGLNYWESKDGSDRRVIYSANAELKELDARTGKPITTFGENGSVDLRAGLGRDPASIARIQSGTPGRVFENLIIMGSATGEQYDSPPGDIRAYDVLTGKIVWTFHTIPHKGEPGYETWPEGAAEKAGGGNVWGEMSVDEKRGIVYAPTAVAGYNFYGGERSGKNLYGDCLLALDARTGKLLWFFQNIHHDIWDMDSPVGPKLLTVEHNGKKEDIVVQVTKLGFVFAFDRVTGEPLWPIEEKPVPSSPMPFEHAYPTQPFPTMPPPFAVQSYTAKDLNPYLSPDEKAQALDALSKDRNEGQFTPPSDKVDTVQMPGNHGGANWGMVSTDPASGSLFVVGLNVPTFIKLVSQVPRKMEEGAAAEVTGRDVYQANCVRCHGTDLKGQPPVIPALTDVTKQLSDNDIKTVARQGKTIMPAFSNLTDFDLANLVAFLHNPAAGPVAPDGNATNAAAAATPDSRYYVNGWGFVFSKQNLPLNAPPWATLTAYDMNKGTIRWQVPLGDEPVLVAKGIKNTGAGGFGVTGGISATAGGLIFSAATSDGIFRAIDQKTGKVVWQTDMPMVSHGFPTIYEVGGREYIVICASIRKTTDGSAVSFIDPNAGIKPTDPHPSYIAYALPR